jgi:hypothetical protein
MDSGPAILDQLRRQNAQLAQHNTELVQAVARLTDQVEQLTGRSGNCESNSSRPSLRRRGRRLRSVGQTA